MQIKTTYTPEEQLKISPSVYKTHLPDLLYIPYTPFQDERGFFAEISRIPEIDAVLNQPFLIKQVNLAHSKLNVIRGFHAEDWNKLVTVVTGTCFCALLDIREDSPTFGQVETILLGQSDEALTGALYIPKGFANSVCVIEGPVNYVYCVDALYKDRDPKHDVALSLFDPSIKVEWPIKKDEMIYSQRDTQGQLLKDRFPGKF